MRKLPIHQNLERGGFYQHDDLSSLQVKYDDHIPVRANAHVCRAPGTLFCTPKLLAWISFSCALFDGVKIPMDFRVMH